MRRGLLWTAAFGVVTVFIVAGATLDDGGQRTWALVSTIGILGVAVAVGVYLALTGLQRIRAAWLRFWPRVLRRRQ